MDRDLSIYKDMHEMSVKKTNNLMIEFTSESAKRGLCEPTQNVSECVRFYINNSNNAEIEKDPILLDIKNKISYQMAETDTLESIIHPENRQEALDSGIIDF